MTQRITQQELESYLWGAAVLLRGLIDAGDYKQFIFPLLFFKRVSDVWDEESTAQAPPPLKSTPEPATHWSSLVFPLMGFTASPSNRSLASLSTT